MCPECASCHSHVHIWSRTVDACDLNTIPRLYTVNKVVLEDDLYATRQLSWRCILWHLLDGDNL